jgi:glycosyltransferase involved in cell wall biosynthesis
MTLQSGLRVAVIGTNDPRNVSGGRYHGLMLAYAVAAAGGEAHVITDHVPGYVADLAPLAPHGVSIHQTHDFIAGLPDGAFDWVIVIPTGIFLPDFYESCLDFAARAGARLGLVNFETGNWFNALAPEPRDPRLWDYWRRLCIGGGLVLSSARVSHDWARRFYGAPEGGLRFEVWCPPINSVAARRFDGLEKDGSILAFVRPQDAHKGSALLTKLNPALYAGRTLRLIAGRDVPDSFRAAMQAHLANARGAELEILLRINELHKFRLLTSAQAVLFPTQFEGFGYPPVEAAYAGTESVCFDLPVLQETVGKIAHFAPTPDLAGFEIALAAALAAPERRAELRAAVFRIADFHQAAGQLADILLRSADRVAPLAPRAFRVPVGPYARARPRPAAEVDRNAELPAFPPYVVSATTTTAGEVLLTGRALLPARVERLEASIAGGAALPVTWDAGPPDATGFCDTRFYLVAPREILRRRILVEAYRDARPAGDPIELQIDRAAPANTLRPVLAGISENIVQQDLRRLRGWVLAREPVMTLCYTPDGKTWHRFAVTGERRDVAAKNPGYPSARCEFSVLVAPDPGPDRSLARLICLAGAPGQERAIDLLTGWPPAPKPHFAGPVAMGEEIKAPAPPQPPAPAAKAAARPARHAVRPPPPVTPRRSRTGTLDYIDHTDANWKRGVARKGERGRLGGILVRKTDDLARVVPGSVLRFAGGAARCVTAIEAKDNTANIVLDGPLDPAGNCFPARIDIFAADWSPAGGAAFVIKDWTDKRWWRGIWNHRDNRYRQGLTVKTDMATQTGLATGARLRFAASGIRSIVGHDDDGHNNRRLWLDDTIRPLADGAPHPVAIIAPASQEAGSLPFSLARADAGWPRGILAQDQPDMRARQAVLLDPVAVSHVRRGTLLRFAQETILRVTAAVTQPDGLAVAVDGLLDPLVHGHPAAVFLVDQADVPQGVAARYRFPDVGLTANDPLHLILATHARRHGAAVRPSAAAAGQRRALVLSPVSPAPANQGNRAVTRNLIRHLTECGFACDVVVQNWVDAAAAAQEFGPDVALLSVPYPKWEDTAAAALRKTIATAARQLGQARVDAGPGAALEQAAEHFHPYFIVRDQTVDIARALYARHDYAAVICNYTHMIRVAVELQDIRPLPPVAVITHDALSRLPREFNGQKLDTMYRACTPALERSVLDAIPGAVVVAISGSEADYFGEIGVENPVVLTEFDAAEEMAPFRIPEAAFERRSIIFHGSANPMNIAGLDWFADECWATIVAAVPDARLIVCGRAGSAWKPGLPGIELAGELPRDDMLRLCAAAGIAINPCVAGTGLKIKTVEAACLGLPAVCLPTAVDGLEDVAGQFAIVASDGPEFAAGCISLLTDASLWARLRAGALATADSRFSARAVYAALDQAMRWQPGRAPQVQATPPAGPEPTLPEVPDPVLRLETNPNDAASLLALGRRLVRASQVDVGWEMVSRVAASRFGDPKVAAQTAAVALEIGEYWQAVVHAATVIAQCPVLPDGYRLMGRGLLGCNLAHDAAAVLQQGILVSPGNERMLALLEEALTLAGRESDAAFWRARRSPPSVYGEYIPFDGRRTHKSVQGFAVERDGTLSLASGAGVMRIVLPEDPAGRISVSLDLRRPDRADQDIDILLRLQEATRKTVLRAKGPRVQTTVIDAEMNGADDIGVALLSLQILTEEPLPSPLRVIGYLLGADRSVSKG